MNFPVSKRHLSLFLLFALAALSWWWQQTEIGDVAESAHSDDKLVDYSLSGFSVIAMDDNGQPRHRMNAEKMLHFAETDYAEITAPVLEMYGKDGKVVRLSADLAQVYDGGDPVLFQGAVQIVQYDANARQVLEILTRDVWFYADKELAETSQAVTLTDAIGITQAEGLRVNMKAGSLQLLAAVRGRYVVH